eukprot:gnl/Carplike_NY0171/3583_a4840_451.p1 GENE.gnl/Carplike_NY0171/3583_a4840_451~~gnl/Carplike_NY0171/3583_a4840_451.p1  ORF type:complete len:308 (+),score=104.42 gnl/Carplike_NY0171/3583_a4840_451:129-926(+)
MGNLGEKEQSIDIQTTSPHTSPSLIPSSTSIDMEQQQIPQPTLSSPGVTDPELDVSILTPMLVQHWRNTCKSLPFDGRLQLESSNKELADVCLKIAKEHVCQCCMEVQIASSEIIIGRMFAGPMGRVLANLKSKVLKAPLGELKRQIRINYQMDKEIQAFLRSEKKRSEAQHQASMQQQGVLDESVPVSSPFLPPVSPSSPSSVTPEAQQFLNIFYLSLMQLRSRAEKREDLRLAYAVGDHIKTLQPWVDLGDTELPECMERPVK